MLVLKSDRYKPVAALMEIGNILGKVFQGTSKNLNGMGVWGKGHDQL